MIIKIGILLHALVSKSYSFFFFGSVVNIKLVRDFVILIFTVSLLFLFYTNNNSVYLLFRLWLVVLLHELHVHDYVQKEKIRDRLSVCAEALFGCYYYYHYFYFISFLFFFFFSFFFFFFFFFIHFKIKYLSMTISKSHISK